MGALRQLARCTGEAKRRMSTFLPSPKTLDDIMKVQHLEGMQPEQIEALWMEVSLGLPSPCGCAAGLNRIAQSDQSLDCSTTAMTRGRGPAP